MSEAENQYIKAQDLYKYWLESHSKKQSYGNKI